jgi:hypothetical protein
MIHEIWIQRSDQRRTFRSHSAVNVQLSHWTLRSSRLANCKSRKLTAIKLVRLTLLTLKGQSKIVNLWPKVLVVSDGDDVLSYWQQTCKEMWLHDLASLFAVDDLALNMF